MKLAGLIAVILASVFACGQSNADDCTLGEVVPILKEAADFKVERIRKNSRDLTERAQLDPTTKLEVSQGGCAHYGVQIRFSSAISKVPNDGLLPTAIALTKALKVHTDPDSPVFRAVVEMLSARKDQPYLPGDIIQDRNHPDATIDVTSMEQEGTRNILITYSYVL